MATEARKRANKKYRDKARVQLNLNLNAFTDADILEWLSEQDNKQGIIKELIRKRIKEETGE